MPSSDDTKEGQPAVITRLATRVAEVRKARGLPRRVLSERSGVSPRYLAQLEAGEGNIPIAVQEKVRQLLSPQNAAVLRAGRIALVGLRGAGKSTLGKMAGEALKLPFVELNKEIEKEVGMPLAEVMALYGEDGYRRMETEALDRVSASHDRMILEVAGGIVAEPATYARLLERFHTIWLRTSPAEHMQRVRAQGDVRPMEGNPAAMSQLKVLLQGRTPLYEKADAQLNTSDKMPRASLNELLAIIAHQRFLDKA